MFLPDFILCDLRLKIITADSLLRLPIFQLPFLWQPGYRRCLFVCLFFGEIAAKRKHLGYRTTRYRRHRNGGREIGRPNKKFHSNNFLVCITQCKIGHKHACMMRGSGPLLVFYKSQRPERAEIWGKQNCARILLWWCIKPMLFWFYLPVRCCLFL